MKKLLTILLLTVATVAMGQYTLTETKIAGFNTAVFTPKVYSPATKKYPLHIGLHGAGEDGGGVNNISRLYNNGGAKVFKAGFNPPYDIISAFPQANWSRLSGAELIRVLDELIAKYPIDTARIYLSGYSAGGHTSLEATGTISKQVLSRFTAIVVLSPAAVFTQNVAWYKDAKTPIWLLGGTQSADNGYSANAKNMADAVNAQVSGLAKLSIKSGIGHGGSFTSLYDTTFKDGISFWTFLQNAKPTAVAPTPIPVPVPTPTPTPTPQPTGLTAAQYAQVVKISDSTTKANLIVTKANHPLGKDSTGLIIKKGSDVQDGYISKELVNKLLSLEYEIARLRQWVSGLQAEQQKTSEIRKNILELLNKIQ